MRSDMYLHRALSICLCVSLCTCMWCVCDVCVCVCMWCVCVCACVCVCVSSGRTAYWSFLAMLRHVVRCCYSNLEVQLLKITKETDEGQVQVRWRLCGHPRWSLSSLLWMRPPESWGGRGRGRKGASSSSIVGREEGEGEGRGRDREGEEEGEGEEEKEGGRMVVVTDGFSVFTVNSEGKIQKHKLDRVRRYNTVACPVALAVV